MKEYIRKKTSEVHCEAVVMISGLEAGSKAASGFQKLLLLFAQGSLLEHPEDHTSGKDQTQVGFIQVTLISFPAESNLIYETLRLRAIQANHPHFSYISFRVL